MSDNTNTTNSAEVILEIQDLCKSFGDHEVLKGISTTIRKGDVLALIGPSGCGKSTFLRSLNLLEIPTSGHVLFEGTDMTDKSVDINHVREKIGMVFQQFNLFPNMTIKENIMLAPVKLNKMTREEAEKKAMDLLKRIGLSDKADAYPSQLSGGQKRRVAIAGVLAMKPEVLILDEPTAGLDPAGRDEILDLIARMHKEKGITVILVSHSMEDVAKYVERIIVMNHGQVMFDNTPCEVFKHYKELEQIGLAAPQVTYLMHELKEKGLNVNTEATTVAEARESLLEVLLGREPNHRGSNLEEENLC